VSQALISISIIDVVDILLVAFLLYRLYSMIRGTAAMTIFLGVSVLYVVWLVVRALNMELTSTIIGQVMGAGIIALLIVFQQEVRRFLLYMGSQYKLHRTVALRRFLTPRRSGLSKSVLIELVVAAQQMGAIKQGALIALERRSDLSAVLETGVPIDAAVQARLLENIFFKNSPLHDGAAIIRHERIAAAQCILPVSNSPSIPPRLGLRHRAAIGLTEESDALVIVVSEETGSVSLVDAGDILEDLDAEALRKALAQRLNY